MIGTNRHGSTIEVGRDDERLHGHPYVSILAFLLSRLAKEINWPFTWEIYQGEETAMLKLSVQPFFCLPNKPTVTDVLPITAEIPMTREVASTQIRDSLPGYLAQLITRAAEKKHEVPDGSIYSGISPEWVGVLHRVLARLQYYTEALPGMFHGGLSLSMRTLGPKPGMFRLYGVVTVHKMGITEVTRAVQFRPPSQEALEVPDRIRFALVEILTERLLAHMPAYWETVPAEVTNE